jgi:hypothetical protein
MDARDGMKWRSHVDIAAAIAAELCLTAEIEEILIRAVVEPDRNPEKLIRFSRERGVHAIRMRHHSPERRRIMRLVWKARLALLEGRNEDAIWCLGKALHYVQDLSVDPGLFHSKHDAREKEIGHYRTTELPVRTGIESSISSPHFVEECLDRLKPKKRPAAALYQATLYSSSIAAAVLDERPPSPSAQRRMLRAIHRHAWLVTPLAFIAASGLVIASLLTGAQWMAVTAPLIGYLVLWADRPYHHLKREARWHGLA